MSPYCLSASLILALLSGSLSHSQETRDQTADLSSGPELQKGIALAQEGDFKKAEEAFEQALTLHPREARVLTALGEVQEQLGKLPAWRRAIALNPQYSEAIYSVAWALSRTDPVQSKQLMDRVQALEHRKQTIDRVNLLGSQANAKMYEANYKGAIDELKNAIVLCGRCKLLGALEKNLGLAYCHAGQLDAGERELKIAETLIPDDPNVSAALQLIEQQRKRALGNSQ